MDRVCFKTKKEHMFGCERMRYIYTPLEDFIFHLYTSLSIIHPHEIDMHQIAQKLNIRLSFWDETSEASFIRGKYRIFINNKQSIQQQWQDFGHELCHVLFHEGYQFQMPIDFILYQELKANNFMYHFCVPTFMLEKLTLPSWKGEAIQVVADTFNVEIEFAQKRLDQYLRNIEGFRFYEQLKEQISFHCFI